MVDVVVDVVVVVVTVVVVPEVVVEVVVVVVVVTGFVMTSDAESTSSMTSVTQEPSTLDIMILFRHVSVQ